MFRFLFVLFISGFYGCAAAPVHHLWPPQPQQTSYRADVVAKGIHTFVVIYPDPEREPLNYRVYGFAEKGWYLEERQGITGAFRALFWPTDSVVEVRTSPEPVDPYEDEEKKIRVWQFALSQEGRQAMIEFLESWYEKEDLLKVSGPVRYYSSRHSYHLFRGCHHYTAKALRAGGLPIRPWWAFSQSLIEIQLNRIEKLQTEIKG